jgi:hypothetical protein
MSEELRDNPESVVLVSMNRLVVLREIRLEKFGPHAIKLAEPLADETVELLVGPLLTSALDDHGGQLALQAGWEIDSHKLVTTFFKPRAALDCEVDRSSKIDQISISPVANLNCPLFPLFLIVLGISGICISLLVASIGFS